MQIQTILGVCLVTPLLAACSQPTTTNTVVVDTSNLKYREIVIELCEPYEIPALRDDWYTCTALTEQDAREIVTHNKIVIDKE